MIKYRTGGYCNELIEKVEIERETEHSVWIKGNRSAKHTSYYIYHDLFESAKAYLMAVASQKVQSYERNLNAAKEHLEEIKKLEQPDD